MADATDFCVHCTRPVIDGIHDWRFDGSGRAHRACRADEDRD